MIVYTNQLMINCILPSLIDATIEQALVYHTLMIGLCELLVSNSEGVTWTNRQGQSWTNMRGQLKTTSLQSARLMALSAMTVV